MTRIHSNTSIQSLNNNIESSLDFLMLLGCEFNSFAWYHLPLVSSLDQFVNVLHVRGSKS